MIVGRKSTSAIVRWPSIASTIRRVISRSSSCPGDGRSVRCSTTPEEGNPFCDPEVTQRVLRFGALMQKRQNGLVAGLELGTRLAIASLVLPLALGPFFDDRSRALDLVFDLAVSLDQLVELARALAQ